MSDDELVLQIAAAIFRLRCADRNVKSSDLARAAIAAAKKERDAAVAEVARLRATSARCPLYDAGCPNSPRPLGATSRTGREV